MSLHPDRSAWLRLAKAEAPTSCLATLEALGILAPLALTDAPLKVILLFEEPNRGPAVSIQVRLVLWMQRTKEFRVVVTNFIVIDGNLVQTKVRQLIGIVDLSRFE